VLDDRDDNVHALPVLRVYDRSEVTRYLAAVEEEAAALERRLAAAQLRRSRASHAVITLASDPGTEPDLVADLEGTLSELQQDEEEHAAALAKIRAAAVADARRILTAAERDVLALRGALQGVLDELDAGQQDEGTPPALAIAVEQERADLRARGALSVLHPAGRGGRAPLLRSVTTGPSLAG
jgi:hypothetical protein